MARFTILDFLWDKFRPVPPVVEVDLSGKNVLVTGANTGIGLEAAKHFATMNPARLFLGCRSEAKGQEALETIATTTGYSNATLWIVDLSSFSSVVAFADRFEAEDLKLDIVVANAGVFYNEYEASPEGWEQLLQVNYLSTTLLSLLLLPRMQAAAAASDGSFKPRLVVVSSETHFWAEIPQNAVSSTHILKAMSDEGYCKSGGMFSRYFETKLLNVFLVHALTSRLSPNSPIIINSVHPGHCKSGLTKRVKFPASLIGIVADFLFAKSCEKGSRNIIWAAVGVPSASGDNENEYGMNILRGAYISHGQVEECSNYALSEEGKVVRERIWDETVDVLSEASPKFLAIVKSLHSF